MDVEAVYCSCKRAGETIEGLDFFENCECNIKLKDGTNKDMHVPFMEIAW